MDRLDLFQWRPHIGHGGPGAGYYCKKFIDSQRAEDFISEDIHQKRKRKTFLGLNYYKKYSILLFFEYGGTDCGNRQKKKNISGGIIGLVCDFKDKSEFTAYPSQKADKGFNRANAFHERFRVRYKKNAQPDNRRS